MESVTLLVALVGCALVLYIRPIYGLAVYIVVSIWYPYGVGNLSIGTIDFSAGRIILIALLLKILLTTDLTGRFKIIWLDRLVVILFIAEIIAGFTTIETMKLLENRLGDFFDMALPYFTVRLTVKTKEQYISLLKTIAWSVAIISIFAFYESLTGYNLLKLGRPLSPPEVRLEYFHRAQVTFRISIYFGVFCAMVGGLCMGLIKNAGKNKIVYAILIALIFLGCFSSMSSGSLLAMMGAIGFICFYRFRKRWKEAIVGIIIMCGIVEIVSNRHFYDVIDRFTFTASTSWYRGKLFEVAFFEKGMSGHWLTGYGFDEPGWGLRIDMRDKTDMVNHYLLELCRYGLVGFIPFCAVIIAAIIRLFTGFWSLANDKDTWLIWCIGGGLFGVLLAFNSVSLFGQPMIMLFMFFGLCVNVPDLLKNNSRIELRNTGYTSSHIPGVK